MRKLLTLFCIIFCISCTNRNTKYTISIQIEGSQYNYYTNSYIKDSVGCIHFTEDKDVKNTFAGNEHIICGSYNLTINNKN